MNQFITNIKNTCSAIITNHKTDIKMLLHKSFDLVNSGIVFAVLASLLTTAILEKRDTEQKIKTQLYNLSNVYIGCNKQWADETFGFPQFTGQKDEYLLCAYISEYYVLQIVFDEAQSAQGYLITVLENSDNVTFKIEDATLRTLGNDDYTLGDFSFYDFPESPYSIYGWVITGNGRAIYAESYYFMGAGNFYDYCIAFLDFGKLKNDKWPKFDFATGSIDDEVHADKNHGYQIITDRKNSYPNTYGVHILSKDVYDILFTYDWFNSQQLRNKLN